MFEEEPNSREAMLSRLNEGFKQSKAQQILRLLKEQEELNKRFQDCALTEDGEPAEPEERSDDDSDNSLDAFDRKAPRVSLRQHKGCRSKTSMGFYNDAEIPADDADSGYRDSGYRDRGRRDTVYRESAHRDSAYRDSAYYSAYRDSGFQGSATSRVTPRQVPSSNPRRRVMKLRLDDDDDDDSFLEDQIIHSARSARSSRPKTGIVESARAMARAHLLQDAGPLDSPRSTRTDDYDMNVQRMRISSAKGDPRLRLSGIRAFCENVDVPPEDPVRADLMTRLGHNAYPLESPRDRAPVFNMDQLRKTHARYGVTRAAYDVRPQPVSKVMTPGRSMLSVDTHNLHTPVPESEAFGGVRRPGSNRVKKRQMEAPRGQGHVSGRSHPVTVMKLPPLDSSVNSKRDLLVVGKEACV